MKKILPLLAAAAVAVAVFSFSAVYRDEKIRNEQQSGFSEEISSSKSGELNNSQIIAENKEGGYTLYFHNDVATLKKGELQLKFANWSKAVEAEVPVMHYDDFDDDGEKELIIKVADNFSDETGKDLVSHSLYLVKETGAENQKRLSYSVADSSLWKKVFGKAVQFQVTQLKGKDKKLQFAMNDASEKITYDEKTGITDNKYVSYARAVRDGKNKCYTYETYKSGLGIYSIDEDGNIFLDIQIFVKYEELNNYYYVGDIHSKISVKDGRFSVAPKTISFNVLDEYKTSVPSQN